jgi:hypothetical protein
VQNANRSPSYDDLLQAAYAFGRADGSFAARFEPPEPLEAGSPVCQGRDPGEFARWLWGDHPGPPPSGLEVNAPVWYGQGFAEGLAEARRRAADRRQDAAARIRLRGRTSPRRSG